MSPDEQPPEPQPEADPTNEQPQDPLNEKLARVLEDPDVLAAFTQEAEQIEAAKQNYIEAAKYTHNLGVAAALSDFPELSGVSAADLPVALNVMGNQNPERAQAARDRINKLVESHKSLQELHHNAAQQQQQQLTTWAAHQDQLFDRSVSSIPKEQVRAIADRVPEIAEKVYGISRANLLREFQTNPTVRSAAFQRMMFDAAKYHLAQEGARNARHPIPQVQRPGTSEDRPSRDSAAIERAQHAFAANPNAKNAAALLIARRAGNE